MKLRISPSFLLLSSLNAETSSFQNRDQAAHLPEITGIITIPYIYIFLFVDSELLSFGEESFVFQFAIQKFKA